MSYSRALLAAVPMPIVTVPVALATALSAWLAYKYLQFWRNVAEGLDVPVLAQPSFPLGNLGLLKNYLHTLKELHDIKDPKSGLSGFWLMDNQVVIVHKAEHAQKVLQSTVYRKQINSLAVHFQSYLGRRNLLVVMNEEWKLHRGLMSKPFQFAHLKTMTGAMVNVAEELVRHIKSLPLEKDLINIVPFMRMVTMDVIGLTAFSHDFGCVRNAHQGLPKPIRAFEFLLSEHTRRVASTKFWDHLYNIPTVANFKHWYYRRVVRAPINDIIRKRREQQAARQAAAKANGHINGGSKDAEVVEEEKPDFLAHMLTACDDAGTAFTDQDLSDELITLMFAGYDTTSLSLSYAVHTLSTHPEIQAELQAEVDQVLEGRQPTYEDFTALKYTTQVLKETLRLYPAAPVTLRTAVSDIHLEEGVVIPKGARLWVPIATIHRSPLNWEHPLEVRPERFAPANVIHPGAWIPFSGGQRNCLGMRFALLEATLVLAVLAQHFTFEAAPGEPKIKECFMNGVVQQPVGGVCVRVIPRAKCNGHLLREDHTNGLPA